IKAGQLQTTEDSPSSSPGEFWSSLLRIKDSDDVYEPFVQCTICQQILSYDVKNETNSLKLHVQNCTKKINLPKSAMSIDCYTNKIATLSSDDKRTKYGLMKTIKSSADILIPDRTNISRTIKQIANEYRLKMNEILRKELKQKASEQLSADQEPTLHLVLPWINKLKIFCQIKADDLAVIKHFKSILLKFINEKTWLTQLHDISTFLHPITKNLSFYSQYEKSNIHKATRRMLKTLNILEENQEIQQIGPNINIAKPKKKPKKMRKDDYSQEDVMLEFALASQDDSSEDDEDEIERYAKAKLVVSNEESVLQWWKKWSINYPTLSVLAKSLLGIPASSCTSERIFSVTGRILEQRRQKLR
ncbi:unnamed protein product, partial [Rotaria socialis]